MPKLPFPSNFSTSNLVFDTGMYCGGILAFLADFSSGISAIMTSLDYKWNPELVKNTHFCAQKSQNSNFSVLFHKTDTTVASGMVENARNKLDSAKNGSKNH
jgi:hypothetical protein